MSGTVDALLNELLGMRKRFGGAATVMVAVRLCESGGHMVAFADHFQAGELTGMGVSEPDAADDVRVTCFGGEVPFLVALDPAVAVANDAEPGELSLHVVQAEM